MRKTLACLVIVALLIFGCTMGMSSISPDRDPNTNLSILMNEVAKCEPDGLWQALSIPDRDIENNHVEYVIYKHIEKETWGFSVTDRESSVVWGYDATQDFFFCNFMGMSMMLTEEQFKEEFQTWIKVICEQGDILKAKRFEPIVQGTEI